MKLANALASVMSRLPNFSFELYTKIHKIYFFVNDLKGAKLTILLISEKYEILYKSMYQVNGELGSCDITDFSTVANLRGRIKELMKILKNHIS